MNEIDKLKIEHARYRAALNEIGHSYATHTNAAQWAEAALNPPPPAVITVPQILTALKRAADNLYTPSLEIFADGSVLVDDAPRGTHAFSTVQGALNYFNDIGVA